MTSIRREIHGALRDELGIEPPSPDTDLIATGLFDSLAVISLLVVLEERVGVRVALDTIGLDDVRSVERLESLLRRTAIAA